MRPAWPVRWGAPCVCTARRGLPCHRVVGGQGRLVPGWPEQRLLLEQEGIAFRENGCADLNACRWKPGEAGL